ncbi:hypothetical protein M8C21_000972 [Ambrosia artemisiifolia]|uniref:Serine aminopeptidase S33 domain-containing protein n=1 Tax=Ambrosia artemisiifolia TaxID=4212 RepID=A0AAD5CXE2_AMBAR|nr:hypothetical protein M8C21_000972 [Ambrosia artemisiifolia]
MSGCMPNAEGSTIRPIRFIRVLPSPRINSSGSSFTQSIVRIQMAPSGIRTEELGVRIKAAVCFVHGYGDTCTFFFGGIAKRIAAAGYGVYAIYHPGFRLSEGLHSYCSNFNATATTKKCHDLFLGHQLSFLL